MHKVSITIPAYNAEKYIAATIESVISQTYKNWELIIVDDCSTDSTVSIIERYIKSHYNITLIKREKRSGASRLPRFDAIMAANGDFVCPIDADDIIEETFLEKLTKRQVETGSDIVLCRMVLFKENPLHPISSVPSANYDIDRVMTGKDACAETIGGWKIAMAGMLAKTSKYKKYIEKHYNNDSSFNFVDEIDHRRFILKADRIAITDAKYYYRQVHDSVIHIKNIRYFDRLKALDILYDFVKSNFHDDNAVIRNMYYEYIGTVTNCRRAYLRFKGNLNKNEQQTTKRMIEHSFRRIKQENMIGKTRKQRIATYNYTFFRLLSFFETILTKRK